MQAPNVHVEGHLNSFVTPEGDSLTERASQRSSGAFSQRRGASPLESQARNPREHERLLKIALKSCHRWGCLHVPLLIPLSQALAGFAGRFGSRHRRRLLHELLTTVTVLFAFAFTATRGRHILECVEETALLRDRCSINQGESLASSPTSIASHQLSSPFRLAATVPEPLDEHIPLVMFFTARNLPIEDLPPAIAPKSTCQQDSHLFAAALVPWPFSGIRLDFLLLALDGHPNAISLDHRGEIGERFRVRASGPGFELVDPFIERAQTDTSLNRRAPALCHLAQTLAEATPEQHILIEIHPEPLLLLSDGKLHDHIMLTLLALHHRHPQIAQISPTS